MGGEAIAQLPPPPAPCSYGPENFDAFCTTSKFLNTALLWQKLAPLEKKSILTKKKLRNISREKTVAFCTMRSLLLFFSAFTHFDDLIFAKINIK